MGRILLTLLLILFYNVLSVDPQKRLLEIKPISAPLTVHIPSVAPNPTAFALPKPAGYSYGYPVNQGQTYYYNPGVQQTTNGISANNINMNLEQGHVKGYQRGYDNVQGFNTLIPLPFAMPFNGEGFQTPTGQMIFNPDSIQFGATFGNGEDERLRKLHNRFLGLNNEGYYDGLLTRWLYERSNFIGGPFGGVRLRHIKGADEVQNIGQIAGQPPQFMLGQVGTVRYLPGNMLIGDPWIVDYEGDNLNLENGLPFIPTYIQTIIEPVTFN